jgi:DNA repair protein SbcC/Rad50
MRPIRLEVRGFTAFRDPAIVEFEGRRLFVITGPTGAGKSSLLDAITWALYGQVPRVGRSVGQLLSQGEREMSVMFDFAVRGQRYRVARRHPGTTSTRLERLGEGDPQPLADRATEVTRQVERILGMDYATFTRAILLPQGEFDSFLRGEVKDRRSILSQLLSLGVYERAGAIARERARQHKATADTIATQLEQLAFATPEVVRALEAKQAEVAKREQAVLERRASLQALGETAREDRDRSRAVEQAAAEAQEATKALEGAESSQATTAAAVKQRRAEVDTAAAEQAALAYDRAEHDRLRAAVALLDQRADAERAIEARRADVASAAEEERAAIDAEAAARAALEGAEGERTAAARAEQVAADAVARAAGRAIRTRTRIEADVAAAEREASTAEEEARALEQRARDLDAAGRALDEAAADLQRADDTLARAGKDRDAAQAKHVAAVAAREAADDAARTANDALDLARREDAAAHLRSGLRPGDPCPVCGEPIATLAKHSAPDLAKAERAVATAEKRLQSARDAAEQASAALAAAEARAGEASRAREAQAARDSAARTRVGELGAAPGDVAAAVRTAQRDAPALAERAATRRGEARALFDVDQQLRALVAVVPKAIQPVEAKRAPTDAAVTIEELRDALEGYATAVEATREASVAAERAAASAQAAARDLAVARRDVERARKALADAEQRLAALGAVEGDPEALRAALAQADERAARAETIAEVVRTAREALAGAEAEHRAAEQALARAREHHERRQTALREAREAQREVREVYAARWSEVIGEGAPEWNVLAKVMSDIETERTNLATEAERIRGEAERAAQQVEQAERMRADVEQHRSAFALASTVGSDLQSNRFIAFLMHESMQRLAASASDRLERVHRGALRVARERGRVRRRRPPQRRRGAVREDALRRRDLPREPRPRTVAVGAPAGDLGHRRRCVA